MISLHSDWQRRSATVPWDRARERRVLERALDSWRRRARQKRALEVSAALMVILLVGRILPHASMGGDEVRPDHEVPAAQLESSPENEPAISLSGGAAKPVKSGASTGFAGTGGHGGTGSTGVGGGAGTG